MKKSLILAEKPSVGRDISRVLGCNKTNQGHYESATYIVTWALGHLITLAAPEKYQRSFSEWTLDTLPMIPKPFKLEIIKNTSKQFQQVKSLMNREDINEIIIATDAGREGELVARWIIAYAQCKKPIKRLWISSVTDKAIRDGFNHLVDGNNYNPLYKAAEARACSDWIVGINGTRALTCKHNASLSMGRVQTPSLALVHERELSIRAFVSQTYYEIIAECDAFRLRWVNVASGQTRIFDEEIAKSLIKKCMNQQGSVKSYKETLKKSYPKGLYDLTELQRDANRLYGFSAKETLGAMQGLYERHKVLTYPRTDSKYLTTDIVDTLAERVRACRQSNFKDICRQILQQPIRANASFVDNAKVGDHHGIIPTEQMPSYSNFDQKEQKIYNLVVRRFLAVLLPPHEYKEMVIEVNIDGQIFKGKGTYDIDLGWKKVYEAGHLDSGEDDLELQIINRHKDYKGGDAVSVKGAKIAAGSTKPPGLLTEGDLLYEMDKYGLGTVATRADIIEKIIANNYVEKQDKFLRSTKIGKQLLELVPEGIKSKEMTAQWEKKLEAIAKGQLDDKVFIEEMIQYTQTIVSEIKSDTAQFRQENVAKKTNARCPECRKPLYLVGEGDNKTFVCKCGYKEKLSAFNLRAEKHSKQMSKKEVQNFISKSDKKEEPFNNPFANLLGELKKQP